VGKHNALQVGPPTESDPERTVLLSAVPGPDQGRSTVSIRIAILGGVLATVMLSGLVWAVNRQTDPDITVLPVDPPSLTGASTAVLDLDPTSTPSATPATPVSPVGSAPATTVGPAAGAVLVPSSAGSVTGTRQTQGPVTGPTGTPRTVAPTLTRTPTRAPTTQAPTTAATARLTAQFKQTGSWPGGYQAQYTITNRGTAAIKSWSVVVTFSRTGSISVWQANASTASNHRVTFTNESYNGTVPPGGSITFGMNVTGSPAPTPTACTVNGASC
jgi:hypothetical protein